MVSSSRLHLSVSLSTGLEKCRLFSNMKILFTTVLFEKKATVVARSFLVREVIPSVLHGPPPTHLPKRLKK